VTAYNHSFGGGPQTIAGFNSGQDTIGVPVSGDEDDGSSTLEGGASDDNLEDEEEGGLAEGRGDDGARQQRPDIGRPDGGEPAVGDGGVEALSSVLGVVPSRGGPEEDEAVTLREVALGRELDRGVNQGRAPSEERNIGRGRGEEETAAAEGAEEEETREENASEETELA